MVTFKSELGNKLIVACPLYVNFLVPLVGRLVTRGPDSFHVFFEQSIGQMYQITNAC